jgi:hypothetical protein
MSYRILVVLIIVGLFLGCNNREAENHNILAKEDMVSIIVEIELIQAAFKVEKGAEQFNLEEVSNSVFESYHATKQQFDESLLHYSKQPQEMENIYNDVISILSQKQVVLN